MGVVKLFKMTERKLQFVEKLIKNAFDKEQIIKVTPIPPPPPDTKQSQRSKHKVQPHSD